VAVNPGSSRRSGLVDRGMGADQGLARARDAQARSAAASPTAASTFLRAAPRAITILAPRPPARGGYASSG